MVQQQLIFDPNFYQRQRQRAVQHWSRHDFLWQDAADRLAERLQEIRRTFKRVLFLGAGGGILQSKLLQDYPDIQVTTLEIEPQFQNLVPGDWQQGFLEPADLPVVDGGYDLVISVAELHFVNDLPGLLSRVRQILQPDGLFLANFFGGRTLQELRQAFLQAEMQIDRGVVPHVVPMIDAQQAASLLQRAGFALPMVDSDGIEVTYRDAFSLMHDLRGMGLTNNLVQRHRSFLSRQTLLMMATAYQEMFSADQGRIMASFELLTMTGWAPAASQPQPLRPGSGKINLAEHLRQN